MNCQIPPAPTRERALVSKPLSTIATKNRSFGRPSRLRAASINVR